MGSGKLVLAESVVGFAERQVQVAEGVVEAAQRVIRALGPGNRWYTLKSTGITDKR